jgi:hypothetical protein
MANSEENGVEPYVAWHTKSWSGSRQSGSASYFDTYFGPNRIEPPTIDACIQIVEWVPGSWCQDDDDYASTWTIYFHPRTLRIASVLTDRLGDSFDLEVALGPVVFSTAQWIRDGSTVSNMSFYGVSPGQDENTGVRGGNALRMGGDGSTFTNIRTYNSDAVVNASHGLSTFTVSKSLFAYGLTTIGNNDSFPNILVEDIEVCCEINKKSWDGPWGTPDSPLVIRRTIWHEGKTYRRRDLSPVVRSTPSGRRYDFVTDTHERIVDSTYFGTHSLQIGKVAHRPRHIRLENSIIIGTSDALRFFNCSENCVIRNNMIRAGMDSSFSPANLSPGSMTFVNNIIWAGDTPSSGKCGLQNCAEYRVSDHNLWINQQNIDGLTAPVWRQPDNKVITLSAIQALDLERNSRAIGRSRADAGAVFVDSSIQFGVKAGGDDYRLVARSPAIDAGSNVHCSHAQTIVNRTCDIGPYEFDASSLTGPPIRPFGELISFATLPSSAPPLRTAPGRPTTPRPPRPPRTPHTPTSPKIIQ